MDVTDDIRGKPGGGGGCLLYNCRDGRCLGGGLANGNCDTCVVSPSIFAMTRAKTLRYYQDLFLPEWCRRESQKVVRATRPLFELRCNHHASERGGDLSIFSCCGSNFHRWLDVDELPGPKIQEIGVPTTQLINSVPIGFPSANSANRRLERHSESSGKPRNRSS